MDYLHFRYFKHIYFALAHLSKSTLFVSSSVILATTAVPASGFQLDFSGTVDGDLTDLSLTDNIGATMRFAGVDPDNNIDLIITVLSAYDPKKPGNNGAVNSNDGRINLRRSDPANLF